MGAGEEVRRRRTTRRSIDGAGRRRRTGREENERKRARFPASPDDAADGAITGMKLSRRLRGDDAGKRRASHLARARSRAARRRRFVLFLLQVSRRLRHLPRPRPALGRVRWRGAHRPGFRGGLKFRKNPASRVGPATRDCDDATTRRRLAATTTSSRDPSARIAGRAARRDVAARPRISRRLYARRSYVRLGHDATARFRRAMDGRGVCSFRVPPLRPRLAAPPRSRPPPRDDAIVRSRDLPLDARRSRSSDARRLRCRQRVWSASQVRDDGCIE